MAVIFMQITEVRKSKASLSLVPVENELAYFPREDRDLAVGARPSQATQGDNDDEHYWGHWVLKAEGKEATAAAYPTQEDGVGNLTHSYSRCHLPYQTTENVSLDHRMFTPIPFSIITSREKQTAYVSHTILLRKKSKRLAALYDFRFVNGISFSHL